jgi:iron complex outermembrane receptor protein
MKYERTTTLNLYLPSITIAACAALWSAAVLADTTQEADQNGAVNVGEVSSKSGTMTAKEKRNERHIASGQNTRIISKREIASAGPVAGAAQVLALTPGVAVSSYGPTGASKASISINGIKTGWAGFSGGNVDNGSLGVSFDGVPMVNPGNGLWQSTLVPQMGLIQNVAVTTGPGSPVSRWYTNLGGSVNFIPLRPSKRFLAKIDGTYGSYDTKNIGFELQTGSIDGWKTVFAGGANSSGNFIKGPDGFDNPSTNYAYYIETQKKLKDGKLTIGAYAARSAAYRPLPIPVSPIPGVTINGYQQSGELYSQATTGFYSGLPYAVNHKVDTNQIALGYIKSTLGLGDSTFWHNMFYYVEGTRIHQTTLHDYVSGSESREEFNNPSSYWLGDKMYVGFRLPYNSVKLGAFVQSSRYHSQEDLYNTNLGFVNSPTPTNQLGSAAVPNGPFFSDIFNQLNTAVFVQDKISPINNITITPGLRFINYSVTFTPYGKTAFPLAYQLNQVSDTTVYGASSKTFDKLEPSLFANWRIAPSVALYGSYSTAYRLPEMGGGTGPFVAIQASNVSLEKGVDYQAGLKGHFKSLGFVKNLGFNINFSHLLLSNETLPTALSSFGFLIAKGASTYNSLNLSMHGNVLNHLYTFVNLGFDHAYFTKFTNQSGSFPGSPVSYVPDTTASLGLMYHYYIHGVMLVPSLTWQYTGKQYMYNNNLNITSHRTISPYSIVNVGLGARMLVRHSLVKEVGVNGQILNLFGNHYNAFEYVSSGGAYGSGGYTNPQTVGAGSILAYPGSPRAFFLSVSAKF